MPSILVVVLNIKNLLPSSYIKKGSRELLTPNSSLKRIEVAEEFKKLSNEHKDTQPGGGGGVEKKKEK